MRELWPFIRLFPKHVGSLTVGVFLAIATLIFSLALLALSGWFITATALAGMTLATARAFDFFSPGAGVRGFSIGRTASRYFERLVSHDATFKVLAFLRSWFFQRLLPLPLSSIKQYRQGELLNRLVADVDALDQLYLRLFSPVIAAVVVVVLLSLGLSFFSPVLGWAALFLLLGWSLALPAIFYRKGYEHGRQSSLKQAELRQQTLDYLQGVSEVRIYGAEAEFRRRIHQAESALFQRQSRLARLDGLASGLLSFAAGSSVLIVLFLAAGEYQLQKISAPVMVLSVFAVLAAFEVLMPLPAAFQFLGRTQMAAGRLKDILEQPPLSYGNQYCSGRDNSGEAIGIVNLSFSYGRSAMDESPSMVLDDFNLSVAAGEHIAVLGRTGCGKSTLLQLLLRQLVPVSGTIRLSGQSIEYLSEKALYGMFSVVPQRTHVFSDTLRNNLLLAKPDASDEQLMAVVRQAGLDRLSDEPETLLDRWLGESGVALSGGEQRRLAVARVLLKDSAILLMDEAGEGLDPNSEEELINKVLDHYQGRTVLMITHRKALLGRMNRIVRMESGKLIDQPAVLKDDGLS